MNEISATRCGGSVDLGDHARRQRRVVELVAGPPRRLDDDALERRSAERPEQLQPTRERAVEPGQLLGTDQEVVAQRDHDADAIVGRPA